MDFVEQTIGKLWKRGPRVEAPIQTERKPTERFWTYEHFREYLLALSRGRDFMLPQDQHPDLIELSTEWNSTIEEAREKTKDTHHEHYFMVGTKGQERTIHIPNKISVGNKGNIPADVMAELHSKSRKFGIDSIPGDVHSHPASKHAEFSLGDLYTLLHPNSELAFIGVLAGRENLFAFKSRESTSTGVGNAFLNQSGFSKYWYEQNGWQFAGYNPKTGAEMARRVNAEAPTVWQLNLKVAKRHGLVLYSGDANTELVKVFPPIKS